MATQHPAAGVILCFSSFFEDVAHNYIDFTGFAKFFYPRAPKKFAHTETSAEQNYHLFKEFSSRN